MPRRQSLALTLVLCLLPVGERAFAQNENEAYRAQDHYTKSEVHIPMRDGTELYTAIYKPKDTSRTYPVLLYRTPYSCRPYGDRFRRVLGPSELLMRDGYIVAYQDVRGRFMSDGVYDNMRPHVPGDADIDESSDTYDTIDWILANVKGNNGRVGMWGVSYPGFYSAAALPEAHPALKAVSPQAPISDFFFDDFHHHGAFLLSYFLATAIFGYHKTERTTTSWFQMPNLGTRDGYRFYLELGPLKNASKYYGEDHTFWQQLVEHPNYDEFWQKRNLLPHLKDVTPAVMTVGGWFDAEDLYGPLNIYQRIEETSKSTDNTLVMGPWSHGGWARDRGMNTVGNVEFGEGISKFYQEEIERPFFNYYLKGDGGKKPAEAMVFDTGAKSWSAFDQWPPARAQRKSLHLRADRQLSFEQPTSTESPYSEYVSDPANPVPYTDEIKLVFTPRKYMTDDQRFASRRPDVLRFSTPPLKEDVTLVGPIDAHLLVTTTGSSADWIVKLIDVYPDDHASYDHNPPGVVMGGYEQMVRSEVMRGRFRNSYEHPEPFIPHRLTEVTVPLQDVYHTFKKGHRIMVHVQSTWFPLIDRNPQKYVDNIFKADEEDFIKATHRVFHSSTHASHLELRTLDVRDES